MGAVGVSLPRTTKTLRDVHIKIIIYYFKIKLYVYINKFKKWFN